jgi:hypothetical protein
VIGESRGAGELRTDEIRSRSPIVSAVTARDHRAEVIIASEQMEFLLSIDGLNVKREFLKESVGFMMKRAWELGSEIYSMTDAIEWGKDFKFPVDTGKRDAEDLMKFGSLEALCEHRHSLIAEDKLSVERVLNVVTEERLTTFKGHRDKERAIEIAKHGMVIPVSDNFKASNQRPPLRKKYLLVRGAVNRILHEMYVKGGTVLLIPTDLAITIPGIHFSSQHWTTKKEKACGRSLGDASNDPHGNSLNDVEGQVQNAVRSLWGEVVHPTLIDLALMILRVAETYGWENLVLWKMDLKGAFGLLRIFSGDVKKLAFELTDNLTLLHTAGMFGWTGTPFAFSVFSRLLEGCIDHDIKGGLKVYVDDLCGCSGLEDSVDDQDIAEKICLGLMGKGSLASDKHYQGRRLDMLGWSFDLDLRTVSVSETNHLKTVFSMFSIDHDKKYNLKTWQAVASRASRYVTVCPHMKPYTSSFYDMIKEFHGNTWVLKHLTDNCKEDLQMWKAFLCILIPFETRFARSLLSFREEDPTIKLEYDASLTGLGIILSEHKQDAWTIVQHIGIEFPFGELIKNDSSYQNSCEFIAIVIGLYLTALLGYRDFGYCLYGDNVSSLSWAIHGGGTSPRAKAASIAMALICIRIQANLRTINHVPGKMNTTTDGLSRGKTFIDLDLPSLTTSSPEFCILVLDLLNVINPVNSYTLQDNHSLVRRLVLGILEKTVR